ncbi:MAG TPA: hypothetical protein VNO14_00640 [Blastocatellia bacterium]|nr:hypothetical protein [Blastocatellia bacterium]
MRRALDRIGRRLAGLTGAMAGVLLALAMGIGAHGGALEINYAAPAAPFLPSCATLADAERNCPFDSGASTSSDHQMPDGNDLVRFLSIRPVIISAPGGPGLLQLQ